MSNILDNLIGCPDCSTLDYIIIAVIGLIIEVAIFLPIIYIRRKRRNK